MMLPWAATRVTLIYTLGRSAVLPLSSNAAGVRASLIPEIDRLRRTAKTRNAAASGARPHLGGRGNLIIPSAPTFATAPDTLGDVTACLLCQTCVQ